MKKIQINFLRTTKFMVGKNNFKTPDLARLDAAYQTQLLDNDGLIERTCAQTMQQLIFRNSGVVAATGRRQV
jgi:hypothetical protein